MCDYILFFLPYCIMTTSYNTIREKNFGEKFAYIKNGIVSGSTPVTIRSWNWIPKENMGTFMYSETYLGWVGFDNNITMSSTPLHDKYQFIINKCSGSGLIQYGEPVSLRNVNTGKFVQCVAGTCSGVDTNGGCNDSAWQTFTIVSAEGKVGQINYGDPVYIRQVVGNKCAITTAGDRRTWCTDGNHNNAYMILLPPNGSVYKDPTAESSYYTNTLRKPDFQKLDPYASNGEDTKKALESFDMGNFLANWWWVFALIIAIIVLVIVIKIASMVGTPESRREYRRRR